MADPSIDLRSVFIARPEHLSSELGGESVILNLRSGVYFGLNKTGMRVWQLLQQPRTVDDIVTELSAGYDVDREVLREDVAALLKDLVQHGLVVIRAAQAG